MLNELKYLEKKIIEKSDLQDNTETTSLTFLLTNYSF